MALADTGAKAEGGVSRFSASYAKPEKKGHQFTKVSKKLSSKQKKERGRRKGEREGREKKERLDYFPDSSKPESEDSRGSHRL